MAFGSSIGYSSLKDAFGIPPVNLRQADTQREQRLPSYQVQTSGGSVGSKTTGCAVEDSGKETFHYDEDGSIECSVVKSHCDGCEECANHVRQKKYGPIGTTLSDLLNLTLIFLLIWILIFKPKF
jgi:hypothetical protein